DHRNHSLIAGAPLSPPPASESWTILAPSSPPRPISPPALPDSLVPPASPWSVDSTPPATPHPSAPPALSGSSFSLAPPWSSVTLGPPWPSGSPHLPQVLEPSAPVTLARRLSVSTLGSTTTCSTTVGQPFLYHGPSLHQLHHGSASWLRPGSCQAPPAPSVFFMAPPSIVSSHVSGLCPNLLLGCSPAFLPALHHHLSPCHIHFFVFLLSPSPSLPLSLRCKVPLFWEGDELSHPRIGCFVFSLIGYRVDLGVV
ncbi:hypothetical protein M9458_035032, partial [Cirrhinus mrigala]